MNLASSIGASSLSASVEFYAYVDLGTRSNNARHAWAGSYTRASLTYRGHRCEVRLQREESAGVVRSFWAAYRDGRRVGPDYANRANAQGAALRLGRRG